MRQPYDAKNKRQIPRHELERLEALYALEGFVGGDEELHYDELVHHIAAICQVPMAAFSLVDIDRQWFKAGVGLDVRQTPREGSFCDHAIRQRELFMIEDARCDHRFHDHPMVTGAPHVRFYAGQTIFGINGHPIGTLCVLDQQPRELTTEQQLELKLLAHRIEETFSARLLPDDAAREHLVRGFYASITSNCDWLCAVIQEEDLIEALDDIRSAAASMMHLSRALGDEPFDEDTEEWEVDIMAETAEAFPM